MNIDKNKTLEQLENSYWNDYEFETGLVERCHKYRKIQLKDLTIENLRTLIGQNIGNRFLIPLALEELEKNILAEGDMYEGDLLMEVLRSEKDYWKNNKNDWQKMIFLFNKNIQLLKEYDTLDRIKKEWFNTFQIFKEY